MGLYEQIRDTAKSKGYTVSELERSLGFARSSINKFNKNKPSVDKIRQIAEFLDVPMDTLLNPGNDIVSLKKSKPHASDHVIKAGLPKDKHFSRNKKPQAMLRDSPVIVERAENAGQYDVKYDLKTLQEILDNASILYDGSPLDPDSVELFKEDLGIAIRRLKFLNNPKKRR